MQKDNDLPDQWLKRWMVMGIFEGIIVLVDTRCPLTNYYIVTYDIYFFCYVIEVDNNIPFAHDHKQHTWIIALWPGRNTRREGVAWNSGPLGYRTKMVMKVMGWMKQTVCGVCGHVAQLTQSISQFALKPGEDEIKAKHWYQFWKWWNARPIVTVTSWSYFVDTK